MVETESNTNSSFKNFLDQKPLFYDEIDYGRFPRIYERIKSSIESDAKIIHVIGTNGKGTTGRYLASALFAKGLNVGHYTSPHIVHFNERIWLNGQNIDDNSLQHAHELLQTILNDEESQSLSYFEYTTLLAIYLFGQKRCEYIVMEAGLGGEYDATAVFNKELTLVTPIDFDHEAFLGNDISAIATTKLNAVQNRAILGMQKYDEVYKVSQTIAGKKQVVFLKVEEVLDQNDLDFIKGVAKELDLAEYLQQNIGLSIAAMKCLGFQYDVNDFKNGALFGRLSKIADNVIVDVGHNPLAAHSVLQALSAKKYVLIYNSYKDKDYKRILEILHPIIKRVEIIEVDQQRVEAKKNLKNILNELKIKYSDFENIERDEDYLVFGSFSVVEAFLKDFYE